jgi:hypothetical protein
MIPGFFGLFDMGVGVDDEIVRHDFPPRRYLLKNSSQAKRAAVVGTRWLGTTSFSGIVEISRPFDLALGMLKAKGYRFSTV